MRGYVLVAGRYYTGVATGHPALLLSGQWQYTPLPLAPLTANLSQDHSSRLMIVKHGAAS